MNRLHSIRKNLILPEQKTATGINLLVRPLQAPGQCRQDYLMDLAERNGYRSIMELATRFGFRYSSLVLLTDSELAEVFKGERLPPKYQVRSLRLAKELRIYGLGILARLCPVCLREGGLVPNYFNYALTLVCRKHEVLLFDRCPACGFDIYYTRPNRGTCHQCRESLLRMKVRAAPNWLSEFQAKFAPWDSLEFNLASSYSDFAVAHLIRWQFDPASKYADIFPRIGQAHLDVVKRLTQNLETMLPLMVWGFQRNRNWTDVDLRGWTAVSTEANLIIQKSLDKPT